MKTEPTVTDPTASATGTPTALLSVSWQPRRIPLPPDAVVARGAAAADLARRLSARDPDSLAALTGVCGDNLLVLIGTAEILPWVDGALYLGRDPAAPGIFLPTTLAPDVPLPLVLRALAARFPNTPPPFAVLPGEGGTVAAVVPLAAARAVDPGLLGGWREIGR